jgi:HSP20 family protein
MALTPFLGPDPFFPSVSALMRFPDEFSTLFEPPVSSFMKDTQAMASTAMDVKSTPEGYEFVADLPGLKKEEVKVQIEDGNILTISGERSRQKEDKGSTYHRMERSTGKFMRKFRLPENADVEKITASAENGVLTVKVPKIPEKEPEQPKTQEIQVQ